MGPKGNSRLRYVDDPGPQAVDYEGFFADRIEALKREGRYRVFADLERCAGDFPRALNYRNGAVEEITVWCSNDYLGMGQHAAVIGRSKIVGKHKAILLIARGATVKVWDL